MEMKRNVLRTAAATVAAVLFLSCSASAAPALSARKAILMDADSGRVLYEKNADERSLIASTTKIMTALLVCEQCNLADRVQIPREAVGIEGSSLYLREGEILSVQDLLYGLMLHSGNDAATALSIYCGGSEAAFVDMMNEKAGRLELSETHFGNPHGLDHDGNYSTARDLAKLAAYAMENEDFYRTVSCKTVTVGNRSLQNHNKLLFRYEGAVGVKTGYTKAAGRILVSAAERDGRRLIAVTIHAPDDWNDHTALLDYGFSFYQPVCLAEKGSVLGFVPVTGGAKDTAAVYAEEDFVFPMAEHETYSVELQLPPFVYAPVERDGEAGTAVIRVEGKAVGSVPLRFEETIESRERKRMFPFRLTGG